MNKIDVQVVKMFDWLPDLTYSTEGSAGFNLPVLPIEGLPLQEESKELFLIGAGSRIKLRTGYKIHLGNQSHVLLVVPRSGAGSKGYGIGNLVGVIDQDYQGEVFITVWNTSQNTLSLNHGEVYFQALIVPALQGNFTYVSEFAQATERGEQGFGQAGEASKAEQEDGSA